MALDDALEAAALTQAAHPDFVALLEGSDRHLVARGELGNVHGMRRKIAEFPPRPAERDLDGLIAVALFVADQGYFVRDGGNGGHGHHLAVLPKLGHAGFFSKNKGHGPDKKISGSLRSFAQYNPLTAGSCGVAQKKRAPFSEKGIYSHKTPEETLRRL